MDTVLRLLSWSTRKDEVTSCAQPSEAIKFKFNLKFKEAPPGGVVGQLLSEFPPVGP